jgi:hypothetical protein
MQMIFPLAILKRQLSGIKGMVELGDEKVISVL